MHGFRDNEVLLQAGYDVIVIYPPGIASGNFSWRIMKERTWLSDSVPVTDFIVSACITANRQNLQHLGGRRQAQYSRPVALTGLESSRKTLSRRPASFSSELSLDAAPSGRLDVLWWSKSYIDLLCLCLLSFALLYVYYQSTRLLVSYGNPCSNEGKSITYLAPWT